MLMMRPLENARRGVAKRPLMCLRLKCERERFAICQFEYFVVAAAGGAFLSVKGSAAC